MLVSGIEVIEFGWDFEFEVVCDVKDLDTQHLILHVNEEDWRNIKMLDDREWPDEVKWFCSCTDQEFDDVM